MTNIFEWTIYMIVYALKTNVCITLTSLEIVWYYTNVIVLNTYIYMYILTAYVDNGK